MLRKTRWSRPRWGRRSLSRRFVSRDCAGATLALPTDVRLALLVALVGCTGYIETDGNPPADGASPTTEYSPYFYAWGWGSGAYAFSSLVDMYQLGGPRDVTIAFVNSDGSGCNLTTDIQDNLADVQAFVHAGGHVRASFGGENGTYIESGCADPTQLADELAGFVDATGITDLDFDIEQGSATSNAWTNELRAYALRVVQDSHDIRVSFTLPVSPNGLDDLGSAVVASALAEGVKISYVNIMTMDYGSGTDLGSTPEASIDATAAQLQGLIDGLSLADAYHMIGVTPMIGANDHPETFTLDDAQKLAAYAQQRELGLASFWAIQRDQDCAGAVAIDTCNGVGTSTFQFNKIFAGIAQ